MSNSIFQINQSDKSIIHSASIMVHGNSDNVELKISIYQGYIRCVVV